VSEGEIARRLRFAGYAPDPSRSGKHFWVEPETGRRLPEDQAFARVREEERRLLNEARWERVEMEGDAYWRRPDSGRLYPPGPAFEVLRAEQGRAL
jgi:hypothetical protein